MFVCDFQHARIGYEDCSTTIFSRIEHKSSGPQSAVGNLLVSLQSVECKTGAFAHVLRHHVTMTHRHRQGDCQYQARLIYPEAKNQRYELDRPQMLCRSYAEQTSLKNHVFWGSNFALLSISRLLNEITPKRQGTLMQCHIPEHENFQQSHCRNFKCRKSHLCSLLDSNTDFPAGQPMA